MVQASIQARRNTEAAAVVARKTLLAGPAAGRMPVRPSSGGAVATSQSITQSLQRTRQLMAQVPPPSPAQSTASTRSFRNAMGNQARPLHIAACRPANAGMGGMRRQWQALGGVGGQELDHTSATLAALDTSNDRLGEARDDLQGQRSPIAPQVLAPQALLSAHEHACKHVSASCSRTHDCFVCRTIRMTFADHLWQVVPQRFCRGIRGGDGNDGTGGGRRGLLKGSRRLLRALVTSAMLDNLSLYGGLAVFFVVVAYVLQKRTLYFAPLHRMLAPLLRLTAPVGRALGPAVRGVRPAGRAVGTAIRPAAAAAWEGTRSACVAAAAVAGDPRTWAAAHRQLASLAALATAAAARVRSAAVSAAPAVLPRDLLAPRPPVAAEGLDDQALYPAGTQQAREERQQRAAGHGPFHHRAEAETGGGRGEERTGLDRLEGDRQALVQQAAAAQRLPEPEQQRASTAEPPGDERRPPGGEASLPQHPPGPGALPIPQPAPSRDPTAPQEGHQQQQPPSGAPSVEPNQQVGLAADGSGALPESAGTADGSPPTQHATGDAAAGEGEATEAPPPLGHPDPGLQQFGDALTEAHVWRAGGGAEADAELGGRRQAGFTSGSTGGGGTLPPEGAPDVMAPDRLTAGSMGSGVSQPSAAAIPSAAEAAAAADGYTEAAPGAAHDQHRTPLSAGAAADNKDSTEQSPDSQPHAATEHQETQAGTAAGKHGGQARNGHQKAGSEAEGGGAGTPPAPPAPGDGRPEAAAAQEVAAPPATAAKPHSAQPEEVRGGGGGPQDTMAIRQHCGSLSRCLLHAFYTGMMHVLLP